VVSHYTTKYIKPTFQLCLMEQELIGLGFNLSESKIYLELLKSGSLQAGDISKRTGINRRTIYDSLSRLTEKGLVGHNITANRQQFFAIGPEIILQNIEQMKADASELLPKLRSLKNSQSNETKVILYKGRKGIKNILGLVLESKEYVSFGSSRQFPDVMQHDYKLFQEMKKRLKIHNRTILSETLKSNPVLDTAPRTDFRFLLNDMTGPTSTFIFDNKVAIFIWEAPYFGILIDSKNVYVSYLEYFEQLWKASKK